MRLISMKITYVTYTCPICSTRSTTQATQPDRCCVCNSVNCSHCSPRGICPACMKLATPEEENHLSDIEKAGYDWSWGFPRVTGKGLGTGCACCVLIISSLMLSTGFLVLITHGSDKLWGFIMLIAGGVFFVISLASYAPKTKKNNQVMKPMKEYWLTLISSLRQRRQLVDMV